MAGGWVALSKNMFLIVINSRSALEIPNYIYICNFDKFIHFRKKMATIVCHFFPPWEVLELLKLVLFNTIHFFFFPVDLLFSGFCFNSTSASCTYITLLYAQNVCVLHETKTFFFLSFSKDHSSVFRNSHLVQACYFGKLWLLEERSYGNPTFL